MWYAQWQPLSWLAVGAAILVDWGLRCVVHGHSGSRWTSLQRMQQLRWIEGCAVWWAQCQQVSWLSVDAALVDLRLRCVAGTVAAGGFVCSGCSNSGGLGAALCGACAGWQ